jgi:hypothetical protein
LKKFGGIKENHMLNKPEILFARIDAAKKLEEMESEAVNQKKEVIEYVSIDDF